jgi:membrane protein
VYEVRIVRPNAFHRLRSTIADGLDSYGRHATSQLAAALAYRFLFSLVPFVALLVSILDLTLSDAQREQLVRWLFDALPGDEVEASVDRALAASTNASALIWIVSVLALLWGATGMMAALRAATRLIWEVEARPPYVRGKLRDVVLVGLAGALVVAAFALSLVAQTAVEAGSDLAAALGWDGDGRLLAAFGELGSSLVITFVALLLLYGLAPPARLRLTDLWPAALLGAIAFELVAAGYGLYLARFANFNAVYGPLGAVFGFLALIYVLAIVLLGGATFAVDGAGNVMRGR